MEIKRNTAERERDVLAALAAWMMVYCSLTSATTRPISRRARSGAVLTVTSLKGPAGDMAVAGGWCVVAGGWLLVGGR
jgi:hypothetical protein